jgi:class 6 POU domain transcription factor
VFLLILYLFSSSDTNEKSALDDDDGAPTIATTLATLPFKDEATITTTTIDGINLEEIKHFAKAFKLRRLALGLTQTQVGQALSVTRGPAYSQSAICRFEKLDITPKSASKIKPVLEKWMHEAELKYGDR